ncbi:MAG: hypothetical protein OXC48_09865 [Endozoicomonadaceae bacterium]|nr:hypothetical protein [Endozoicomonadaceae bacterium]MCY4330366.1 hypothetical protein [Endozoicomonadaceae bacterium]
MKLESEFVTHLVSTKKLSQKAYTAQIKKVMARELFNRNISRPEPPVQESRIREDLNRTGPDDIEIFE